MFPTIFSQTYVYVYMYIYLSFFGDTVYKHKQSVYVYVYVHIRPPVIKQSNDKSLIYFDDFPAINLHYHVFPNFLMIPL